MNSFPKGKNILKVKKEIERNKIRMFVFDEKKPLEMNDFSSSCDIF